MDNLIIFAVDSEDQIALHLARDYTVDYWENINDTNLTPKAILIDFNYYNLIKDIYSEIIDFCILMRVPIIFLNITNAYYLSSKFGLGFKSKALVVRPYLNFDVFDNIDLQYETKVNPAINYFKCKKPAFTSPLDKFKHPYIDITPGDMASKIDSIINSEFTLPVGALENPKLPESQYKRIYLNIIQNLQISKSSTQKCFNETVVEINLFASFNPQNKYLQVRTLGRGINANPLTSDSSNERGWFQGDFNISMNSLENNLILYSQEPTDIKNMNCYTAGGDLTIGINTIENQTFDDSFNVITNKESKIQGFTVNNKSVDKIVEFHWLMEMLNKGFFNEDCIGVVSINKLPSLAISDLQPLSDSIWQTNTDANGIILFNIKLQETLLYAATAVTENIVSNTLASIHTFKQTYGYFKSNPLNINTNIVKA